MDEVARLPEDAWCPMPAEDGVWRGLEVAEIGFVPNMWARQKAGHVMRIVVTRRELVGELGMGLDNIPTTGGRPVYRVRCDFTNIPAPGETAAGFCAEIGLSCPDSSVAKRSRSKNRWPITVPTVSGGQSSNQAGGDRSNPRKTAQKPN